MRHPFQARRFSTFLAGLAGVIVFSLAHVAAADQCDMQWSSGIYKGTVEECATNAAIGIANAGFTNVGTSRHTAYISVHGYQGAYYALVLCTAVDQKATYSQLVEGPTGTTLDNLFTALDKNFK
jgi:hypothetical protein